MELKNMAPELLVKTKNVNIKSQDFTYIFSK